MIGAGIVGATIAYRLARDGARVRLVDRCQQPGQGVSGRSFGWVNSVTADPENDPDAYELRLDAYRRYDALNRAMGGQLYARGKGALVWGETDDETEAMVHRHARHGADVRLIDRSDFWQFARQVAAPPGQALHALEDFCIDPVQAISVLVASVRASGADVIWGRTVESLTITGGAVRAVRFDDHELVTDQVVIAAGMGARDLLMPFQPEVGIAGSVAALVTLSVDHDPLDCVLKSPEIEIRSKDDRTMIVSTELSGPDTPENRWRTGDGARSAVETLFGGTIVPRLRSVEVGERPMPDDGRPLVGQVQGIENLFVAVAHPGVILAPAVADTIAEMVTEQDVSTGVAQVVL